MTKTVNFVLITLVLVFLSTVDLSAQSTEIAYQGSLKVSGQAANANYDFEFRLFDALSGGTQQGSVVPQNGVAVTDGVFAVRLDFGPVYPGADRYLEISVRPAGGGGFTLLNPRQKIASTPYAVRSLSAGSATLATSATNAQSLGGVPAAQYVLSADPRMIDARNPLAGSGNYIQNSASPQATSNFNISGTGTAATFNTTAGYFYAGSHLISASGLDNLFAGAGAGLLNTGNNNAFFGPKAGFENKGGSFNSFFGGYAGQNNATGNSNSFFGYFAGNGTTSGNENSFFGYRAGQVNTLGGFNSFFGTSSGLFNITGSDNSFFGNETGYNSNGNRNSFFGSKAGRENSSGSDNAFLGSFAGRANTTGSNNAFVGSQAGSLNATGTNNSFFGANAGFSNTASSNSFFGMDSGHFNSTGANNSFFGKGAGVGNTVGELNVFIGANTGSSNVLGNSNTLIGANANVLTGNLSYATAIGSEAVATTSNSIFLGRPVDTVKVPGSVNVTGGLTVSGTLTATNLSVSSTNITGVIGTANGGTGLSLSGTTGNFLRSDGTTWTSAPFSVNDVPSGSGNYIQNTSVQQATSNFSISGNGTAGGMLSGNGVNSFTQYNINNARVLSNGGTQNLFAGVGSGAANTTGSSNSFFGASAGALNTSATGNSFFGANAGAFSTGGNNTLVGVSSGSAGTSGTNNAFFGASSGLTNTIGGNNTLVGANTNVGANNLTYATAIGSDVIVTTSNSIVLGRTADTVRVPGNLIVTGSLQATSFSLPATNITGIVAVANGGTGVASSGSSGSYLRSNGSAWVSSSIAAVDLPSGSTSYIQNGTGLQTASNFNISGTGSVGGAFSANSVDSTTQYNIGGTRVFTTTGTANTFVGQGTAVNGNDNSFFGFGAGAANSTGFSNTILGSGANVGAGNLSFATAVGAGAVVSNNSSVVLGRASDTVRVPGNLTVSGNFSAPSFTVSAANITGIVGSANGGTGLSTSTGTSFLRGNGTGGWASSALSAADIIAGSTNYVQNGITPQAGTNFNIAGSGTIGGNLTVTGSITGGFSVPASNITGVLSRASGGTGLSLTGLSGNFLRSDGTNWVSSPIASTDIVAGSTNYIQNGTGTQLSSNFNISGTGTVGGLFSANAVNSATQYNVGGIRAFSTAGTNNVFVGADTATTGSSNTFVGDSSGTTNTIGTSNTMLGANSDVGANNLSFATAVGAGAVVNNSSSVVLGRAVDTVRVPGNFTVTGTFSAPSLTVPAANITGQIGAANGGTGLSSSTGTSFLRGNGTGGWTSGPLVSGDIVAGSTNYVQNGVSQQTGVNFNIGGNGTVGGNLNVGGSITGSFSVPASNVTGILPAGNGGTGLGASTGTNFLRGNGTGGWSSVALSATDIPLGSTGYIQNGSSVQALSNFNVSGTGAVGSNFTVGGNLSVTGSITGAFSVPAANITGVLSRASGGTGLGVAGANGNFLRSDGTNWISQSLSASDIVSGSTNYIQNGTALQTLSNFHISGSGNVGTDLTVGGNLTVNGSFGGTFTVPAANITGVIPRAQGGTGLTTAGAAGNFLRSDGTNWSSQALTLSDIPNLSAGYIQNTTTTQGTSNFSISGNGTAAGTLSGDTVNAVTQYNIGGTRVFFTSGANNIFAGAGTGIGGSNNAFFGASAGTGNGTGSNNTVIGSNANVGSSSLSNSAAIGARAQVDQSNSLVLGSVSGVNGAGASTKVGIGTTTPKAALDVTGGNILVANPGQGVILKSPDGATCKLLGIDNAGAMSLSPIPCP